MKCDAFVSQNIFPRTDAIRNLRRKSGNGTVTFYYPNAKRYANRNSNVSNRFATPSNSVLNTHANRKKNQKCRIISLLHLEWFFFISIPRVR